jgi:hypothetical protein
MRRIVLPALLLAGGVGCTGPALFGGQTGEVGRPECISITGSGKSTDVAFQSSTSLGFTAEDVTDSLGSRDVTLRWFDGSSSAGTVALSAVTDLDVVAFEPHHAGCIDHLEIPVTARVASGDGALLESTDNMLYAASPTHADLTSQTTVGAGGTFDYSTIDGFDPDTAKLDYTLTYNEDGTFAGGLVLEFLNDTAPHGTLDLVKF